MRLKHYLPYYLFFLIYPAFAGTVVGQDYPLILPMEERASVIDGLLEEKIQSVLPELMRREGIDMWVIISREYNEDPVLKTMLPANWHSARRRTILIMYDPGPGYEVETLAVARYDVGKQFKKAWDKETQPDQWARVAAIIRQRDPKRIGVNKSVYFGLADGISATDLEQFTKAIDKKYSNRIVSAEKLAIGWLETRTPSEMEIYPQICRIAHKIIDEAFSEKVIQPGVTTTEDVVWWMRDKVKTLHLEDWFHPTVSVQRADPESFDHLRTFSSRPAQNIIRPGDLLHVDFGITYLRLNTDTQQHAYVLRASEKEAPAYLVEAFKKGNRLQDILTSNFKIGRTGNELLAQAREQALAEGLQPSIYSHPIGYHGHGAGTTIGLWDQQEGVPVTGDYPLYPNTAYSIELNTAVHIEEWGKQIRIMLEEDAYFDGNEVNYIDGRQKELLLIPRSKGW